MFEARVPIRIKTSREASVGNKKPPVRETSQENRSRLQVPEPSLQSNSQFSPDTTTLRDKLREAQESLFKKEQEAMKLGHEVSDYKLQLEEATAVTKDLEGEVGRLRKEDGYFDRIKTLLRQSKPSISEIVELSIKEERDRLQDKYDLMMEMLDAKEKSLNASVDSKVRPRNAGQSAMNDLENMEVRSYVVKLEKIIREREEEISHLKKGFKPVSGEAGRLKSQLEESLQLNEQLNFKVQELDSELLTKTKDLDSIKTATSQAAAIVESSFKSSKSGNNSSSQ